MDNLAISLVFILLSLFFVAVSVIGTVVLIKLVKSTIETRQLQKEDGTIPIDPDRLCDKPHNWEPVGLVSYPDSLENKEGIESKAKGALACVECGLIAGKDAMLGAGAVGRLRYHQEKRKLLEKLEKMLTEKKTKVILDFSDKTGVDRTEVEDFVKILSSVLMEVEAELKAQQLKEILGELK